MAEGGPNMSNQKTNEDQTGFQVEGKLALFLDNPLILGHLNEVRENGEPTVQVIRRNNDQRIVRVNVTRNSHPYIANVLRRLQAAFSTDAIADFMRIPLVALDYRYPTASIRPIHDGI